MQNTKTETARRELEAEIATTKRRSRFALRSSGWRGFIPYVYIATALPTALLLCLLIPPMQSLDEGRHFLRACQIAQGQIVSEIQPNTHQAGGWLPAAASDFVRDKMTPEYLRKEDRLHGIGERLRAVDQAAQSQPPLSQKKFASFPAATIYPPSLYLPQVSAIRVARLFSNKIYIWFYSARLLNAIAAILLVFFALRLAPAYQFPLMIPAILPMSMYQMSSVSSDAGIIALSILFAALCSRFLERDGALIRAALIGCLFLLVTGKPVYSPLALLLLPAHKHMGSRRAVFFFCATVAVAGGAYIAWSYVASPFLAVAGQDFAGFAPSTQLHFIAAHPIAFARVLLRTLRYNSQMIPEVIGRFGWNELPLPQWFYRAAYSFLAAVLLLVLLNGKRIDFSRFLWCSLAAASMIAAIIVAGFVLWTPVGSDHTESIQGRYLLPVLPVLAFFAPPLNYLGKVSRIALAVLVLAFLAVSSSTTVRIAKHYYFRESKVLGRNIHELFTEVSGRPCSAKVELQGRGWFSGYASGRADARGNFRVLITNEEGTILAESDPVLAGTDFPYVLLSGASHSRWFAHFWIPNRTGTVCHWLVVGKDACTFGRDLKLKPYHIPDA